MDVYIPEDYVAKRRMERRKSSKNGKTNSSSGGGTSDMSRPPSTASQPYKFHRSELMMGAPSTYGFGDAVLDCFSA